MRRSLSLTPLAVILVLMISLLPMANNRAVSAAALKVQYLAYNTNATDGEITPWFRIVNTGSTAVTLDELTLRYWYTVDGDTSQNVVCDWAQAGCSSVTGSTVKLATAVTGADYYMQVGFAGAGTLAAGTFSEIQMRLHKSDWSAYDESDDYSFDPTKTSFADWDRVTLYHNGTLVWGAEPGGLSATPTNTPTSEATPTNTPTSEATPTNTPTSEATPTNTPTSDSETYPAWEPGIAYAVGDRVSYAGLNYECLQAHTSQEGWEPPNTPALWSQLDGSEPTPTNTPEATPTNTPTSEATPTNTPEATPTNTPTSEATPTNTPEAGTSASRVIGYFVEWGVYGRDYHVKNIHTSGSASQLTHINYAFSNISADLKCQIGDAYADYDKYYDEASSVDGTSDSWDTGALRGSFNQLRKLKAMHPHLKVLISIGGWSWSDNFSDAALPENRAAFVASCIDMFVKGNFASGLSYPGIFDGIDIDWEYPGACGETCNYRPEDTQNFTALLAEFRSQLDQLSAQTGEEYLLTIAAPAGPAKIDKIEVDQIHQYLDFINLMTYDFHGAWDTNTNFQSALYPASGDPDSALQYTAHEATQTWLTRGTPADKLVVGVPFYGRGWQDVPGTNNGLWQSASGAAPGTYENGIEDYKVLKNKGYTRYYHAEAQAAWLYSGGYFWTFDDPAVMSDKTSYIKSNSLGGVMFWELSGDTADGELITSLYNGLN